MEGVTYANNLFISYLERLRAKCVERGDGRSVVLYEKALVSLKRYPVPLRSVKEVCTSHPSSIERKQATNQKTFCFSSGHGASQRGSESGGGFAEVFG